MRVTRSVFWIGQILVGFFLISVVLLAGYLLLQTETPAVGDAENLAIMARLEASAAVYYNRLNFYDGVCSDIGVPEGFVCHESERDFAIEKQLQTGEFYCVDSTGFTGKQMISKGLRTSCQPQ